MDYSTAAGWGNVAASVIQTSAARSVARTQMETANYIRGLNKETLAVENARDAELTALQRWRKDYYNKRVMDKAASDQEALATNFMRQKDAMTRVGFADQIRYAEAAGRQQAAAAASGVTGSVVDAVNMSLRMKQAMETNAKENAGRQMEFDYNKKLSALWWANMDRLDNSLIFDNPRQLGGFDYTSQAPGWASAIKASDVKAIAQGNYDFNFNLGSFQQNGGSQVTLDDTQISGFD